MTFAYATKLSMRPRLINIGAQKIDGSVLEIHNITSTSFLFQDSQKRVQFFKKIFLLTDISMEIVLKMSFLALSNTNVEFIELGKFICRSYITIETLLIINRIKLINKKEFAKAVLDENLETFIIHISALEVIENSIHPFQVAQIADL